MKENACIISEKPYNILGLKMRGIDIEYILN